jgi:hypothetical protein
MPRVTPPQSARRKATPISDRVGRGFVGRDEGQRGAVDAVAPAGGGAGAVGEDVAEVAVAARAAHLRAGHAITAVEVGAQMIRVYRPVEARPSCAGIVLVGGREERQAAAGADVGALAGGGAAPRTAIRRFGAVLAQDLELLGGEALAPLGFAEAQRFDGNGRGGGLAGRGYQGGFVTGREQQTGGGENGEDTAERHGCEARGLTSGGDRRINESLFPPMANDALHSHLFWLSRHTGFPRRTLPAEAQRLLLVAVAAGEGERPATDAARSHPGGVAVLAVRQRAHALNRSHAHFKSDNRAKV